jgi:hypothetical protein
MQAFEQQLREAGYLETRNNHGFRAATGLIAGVTARGAI